MNTLTNNSAAIDWKNIDLNSPYERNLNLLENYTFETLLLEVECNLTEINKDTIRQQAQMVIKAKYREALEILEDNIDNLLKDAKRQRAIK